jgi:hypothetical protein
MSKTHIKGSKTLNLKNLKGKISLLYERIAIDSEHRNPIFNKNFEDFQW